ncbi:MAG: phenylalanine--tRNA ligase subunit alpha [Sphingomonadales bacterium]|nr:phenylalanine--tRNA ligase subunit alpha [Sphingomonadales bacterium]PIX66443.1 MAG: phenylalanine--tRNA ligase subunit alpha [Sphingomonadales bacterium CG_4_10_14_3_um_filter_58_15]NCO50002.1 phenylalanine--tRNA ligase subunit alpha [Sphingomonadales bacterium]NCP00465.1 phenylalanine--tRNA ligase subunit alpha [Sphingomonadales bacterium]NCP26703.1 phenylalanine--tRNA ligase subunit alpha [Sphingomonadales bacterium]
MSDIEAIRDRYLEQIDAATDGDALEAIRLAALGKKGEISLLLKTLGQMTPEERQEQGPKINGMRQSVADALTSRKEAMETAALDAKLATEKVDLTLPAPAAPKGSIHPVSQVMDELAEIFADLGFSVATGPEIEDDWHNFTALNIPDTHPARAMHDTFYFPPESATSDDSGMPKLLRTHTSPVQIRTMMDVAKRTEGAGEPIYLIAPGRTYRSDSDATHTPMFHQVEGLVIDKNIHMGHLKWTLETFVRAFFERDDIELRLRPSYFPFTEPSAEVDVGFSVEKGRRIIGGDSRSNEGGWMEILGSGMVHPNVIRNCGLDPDIWQGFAFGCGIDRLAMLKYGMDDLRAFFDGDLRWADHYGFGALDVPTLSGGVGA